jgi:tetratricopeptide (TPR) repeat protein
MAEPPGSEGRVAKPPPVPPTRQTPARRAPAPTPPMLPAQAAAPRVSRTTQREFGGQGTDESTQRVTALGDITFLEEVVHLLSAEAEALLTTTVRRGDPETLIADMNLRMALLSWDVAEDEGGVAHYLEQAERHPLTPRLILAHALSSGSPELLDAAQAAVERLVDPDAAPQERALLALELAEAWLYRLSIPARAVDCARDGLRLSPEPGVAIDLHHVLCVALAMIEDWPGLVEALINPPAGATPQSLAEAAHILLDRTGEREPAAELCLRIDKGNSDVAFHVAGLVTEIALADPTLGVVDMGDALSQRLALLETDPAAAREASATRYLLVHHLAELGDVEAAGAALTALLAPGAAEGEPAAWGARLAALMRWRLLLRQELWPQAAELARELADRPGAGRLALSYRRRAAELCDARAESPELALDLWRQVHAAAAASGDDQAERAIERLLQRDPPGLVAHLEAVSRRDRRSESATLRRAAALAETRSRDLAGALRLRRAALTADGDAIGRHADLIRLTRRARDRAQLAELYRELADAQAKDEAGALAASALLCSAGALELVRGQHHQAEELFRRAVRGAPGDLTARVGLASLMRRTQRPSELAVVLTELCDLCASDAVRFDLLRELAEVSAGPLADRPRARVAYERALEIQPDDGQVLHELARLCDQERDWGRAVELRRRAVDLAGDDARVAELLLEIGGIEESQRRDDAAALAAYDRVLELDPGAPAALEACARLYRKGQRNDKLLSVLHRQREAVNEPARLVAIHLEIAQVTQKAGDDVDRVIAAYRDALAVEADNEEALRGLDKAASGAGRWDALVECFQRAPETPINLQALARAFTEKKAWPELADVRLKQIATVPSKSDKAELARSLADLYQNRLKSPEDAMRMYQRALQLDPQDADSQRNLVRLLEASGRWRELGFALERELATVPDSDIERQVTLLSRIGDLRREHLNRPAEAAQAYELVLERRTRHLPAIEALEEIYAALARPQDLLRILTVKAEVTGRPADRAQLMSRIAQLREATGEVDAALAAYQKAFSEEPNNRELFNSLEKLAYRHERWTPVMELYAEAIRLVESGESRAYRLGDLYARRGEVQLRYLHELGEAAVSYLRVVELEPDNDEALAHLEAIFAQQEDWRGLIAAYEKRAGVIKDPTRKAAALRGAARVAAGRLVDPDETVRLFRALLAVEPTDQEALVALERHHEKLGEWDQLVEVLRSRIAVVTPGDETVALLQRIAHICEEGLRDDDRAIEHYQRLLAIAPAHKQALEALGRIYESTERWADFVDVTRRQIKIATDRNVKALLYFKCGSVMEAKFGKEDDAIRYYDAAIKTSPACLPAVHGLRDLYRRREDWPRVIQTLELEVKLWQDDKERAGVFAQIGRIYAEQLAQPERGLHYYESALAVDPDCVPANRALFDQYFDAGEWERALPLAQALAQKAMRDGDPSTRSEFYRKRGVVIWRTGDPRAAAESIIIALEIRPNNVLALDALGELAKAHPTAYDFPATYRELEKIYRKREDALGLLARVMVAQAVMVEREGDLDEAERLYAEAASRSPGDFGVLSARVDLYVSMRRWKQAVETLMGFLQGDPAPAADIRVKALLRIAEITADGEMEPHKAIRVLVEIIRHDESVVEAHYLLAQEYFSLGRYHEARAAIERVIELAAAPGLGIAPEQLARYYYYLGRIIEAGGDARAATSHYRRAAEYDPGYAPPALALAARAADLGDQAAAETLLIDAAHAAMQRGGEHAAVPMQRGLARILLTVGDRPAAIEAYRGILAVEPDNAADRMALAEIYAHEDLPRAIEEVKQVIQRDLRHAPAYRLMASFYARAGETERAVRVLTAMEVLGYAEDPDRRAAAKARAEQMLLPIRHPMSDDLRRRFLSTPAITSPLGELFEALVPYLTSLFPEPPVGTNLVALGAVDDPEVKLVVADSIRLFGIEPEIYIGQDVPRGVVALSHPRSVVVIDRELLRETDTARRFLFGWAFDAVRGGYALLQQLGRRQRAELGGLLKSMLLPENERPGPTNEFMRTLPRAPLRVIERLQGMARMADSEEWIDGMLATDRRAGLFACDDFAATTRMIARLGGDHLGMSDIQALALVLCGEDLVRFYLSDEYHRLRESLSRSLPAVP